MDDLTFPDGLTPPAWLTAYAEAVVDAQLAALAKADLSTLDLTTRLLDVTRALPTRTTVLAMALAVALQRLAMEAWSASGPKAVSA